MIRPLFFHKVLSSQNRPLTNKVTGGLTLFRQTGMVRALSVFCMVEVAAGFGTRKLSNSSGFPSQPF